MSKKSIEGISITPFVPTKSPFILERIFDPTDKRFIILISGSEKGSLIKYITNSYQLHSTKCHASDVPRIWRSFEMRQLTLKYVHVSPFGGDLSDLPLLTWRRHQINLEGTYQATFKYLIEDDGSLYFSRQLPIGSVMRVENNSQIICSD